MTTKFHIYPVNRRDSFMRNWQLLDWTIYSLLMWNLNSPVKAVTPSRLNPRDKWCSVILTPLPINLTFRWLSYSSSVNHQEFFTVHAAMVYVIQVLLTAYQTYTISVCTVKTSWWWTEELSETCRVLFQNKFEKLMHLVGFIIRILPIESFIPKQIWEISAFSWFYYKNTSNREFYSKTNLRN